jgi:hypothetical protein
MTDQQQYDPNDYTVEQVNEYLATASDEEKARVLEAEKAGQGRVGIVGKDEPQGDGTTPGLNTSKADTVAEAGEKATEPEGEAYAKGYFGHVPSRDGDKPVDLTLAGVTGQSKDA